MNDRHLTKCSICGHPRDGEDNTNTGTVRGNTSRFLNQQFRIWRCSNCQSLHSLTDVQLEDIYKDYPVNIYQRLDLFAKGRFWNLLGRLKDVGLQKHHEILDMGCGNGVFVAYLQEKGFRHVIGYDPFVPAFSHLDKKKKFDFIIANDVIEHVDDPRQLLNQCAEALAPGGTLYVGTADSEDVYSMQDLEKHIMRLHQPFHRLIMTQASLKKLGTEIPQLSLIKTFRRSYMDTLWPFINYRFLDEFNLALGHEMDLALKPEAGRIILKKPILLFFAFFGYFFPSAMEPSIILRKNL
jgi:2-polyprenyl-3-methyl-5-hydroxy-6-metoxy-1,4-benzoquinol methylase